MSDMWRISVKSFKQSNGVVAPAIIVDLKIERRLVVLSSEVGDLRSSFGALGISEVEEVLLAAQSIRNEDLKFINVPWTKCKSGTFETEGLIRVLSLLNRRIWWSLEGSAKDGLVGVISSAGYEVRIDFSEANLEHVIDYAVAETNKAKLELNSTQDQDKRDAIQFYLDALSCIVVVGGVATGNTVGAGVAILAARSCYAAYNTAMKEAEAAKKRQLELEAEAARNECGEYGGGGASGNDAIGKIGGAYTRNGGL